MPFFRTNIKNNEILPTDYCYTCQIYNNGIYSPLQTNYSNGVSSYVTSDTIDVIIGDNVVNCANMFYKKGSRMNKINHIHIGNNVIDCSRMFQSNVNSNNFLAKTIYFGNKVEDVTRMFSDVSYDPSLGINIIYFPKSLKKFNMFMSGRKTANLNVYFNGDTEESDGYYYLGERYSIYNNGTSAWNSSNVHIHGSHNLIEKFKATYELYNIAGGGRIRSWNMIFNEMDDGNGYIGTPHYKNGVMGATWAVKLYNNYYV